MNKAQLKKLVGTNVAVVTGTMYEGASNYPARIIEIGAEVKTTVYSGRSMYGHTSRTNDGVLVVMLDSKTLQPQLHEDGTEVTRLLKSRQVTMTWSDYVAQQKAVKARRAALAAASTEAADAISEWAARLGIEEYQMPSVSSGHTYDANTVAYNRKKLAAALQAAYELGKASAKNGA